MHIECDLVHPSCRQAYYIKWLAVMLRDGILPALFIRYVVSLHPCGEHEVVDCQVLLILCTMVIGVADVDSLGYLHRLVEVRAVV